MILFDSNSLSLSNVGVITLQTEVSLMHGIQRLRSRLHRLSVPLLVCITGAYKTNQLRD